MKKTIFILLFSSFFIAPVYADAVLDRCTAEAKDAGIEDPQDFRAYVDECVDQTKADMEQGKSDEDREDSRGSNKESQQNNEE